MIREHHQLTGEEDYRVTIPVVAPWEENPMCPKCNHCVKPRWLGWLIAATGRYAHQKQYCPGDQNSKVKVAGMNMVTQEVSAFELPTICFGIIEEHLHILCTCCGWKWLMECKTKVRRR